MFYGHVLGCKGLERKVVVLCVNERMPRERVRERLYVGLSRATDKLIVVGPPDVIRDMGGPAVAKKLGHPMMTPTGATRAHSEARSEPRESTGG